jgi:hypothetical protein
VVDVSAPPGPMRQEVTWCVFRVIEVRCDAGDELAGN